MSAHRFIYSEWIAPAVVYRTVVAQEYPIVKMQAVFVILVLLCAASCCYAAGATFDYNNQTAWPSLPGSVCGLNRQSPIDIISGDASTTGANLINLQLEGWNMSVNGTLQNTGRTLKFTPLAGGRTEMTNHIGGYTLAQFHLHWGNTTGEGSEHLLNGRRYEAEIHFVHARTRPPSTGTEGNAFSVVGVFLHAEQIPVANTVWEKFMNAPVGQDMNVSGITYDDFLPTDRSYFFYEGSLTTPPCSEVVQWFVMQNSIPIPEEILTQLRALPADANQTSVQAKNYREPQALNGRQVYRFNSANTLPVISMSLLLIITIAILFI